MPSSIFTANAAWLALAVLAHNLGRWRPPEEAGAWPPPKRGGPSWSPCPPGSSTAPDVCVAPTNWPSRDAFKLGHRLDSPRRPTVRIDPTTATRTQPGPVSIVCWTGCDWIGR
jgi:hypothetical protein